ncbi:large ribosomal subunit protein eL29-like [Desmodus rotundus]|uniref:large ribosomal subunit protein eL29-like n=1 Tax=Desmodus rotundus TaxID=9430 RepID=UPI000D17F196|nr:60S ribosomal protein L29-like [Desmodus rotundus]
MHFAKKHNKKCLKKMQTNTTKAIGAHAEAIKAPIKPKEVTLKIPKGGSHKLSQLAYIIHRKLGKCTGTCIAKGLRLYQTKAKAKVQTKPQALAAATAQGLKGGQTPTKAPQ